MAITSNGSFTTDRDISSTITDAAHTVGDKVRDRIDGAGSKLGDLASRAQHGVMDAKQRVQSTATDFSKNSRTMVKDNPIMAVAIGVGVGFILGRVLFRVILDTVVEELHRRLDQAKASAPDGLLQNRWLQLGVALAVGYAIGRSRSRIQMGPFGRSLATAAISTLVRTAMQSQGRPPTIN